MPLLSVLIVALLTSCSPSGPPERAATSPADRSAMRPAVTTGAQRLVDGGFAELAGLRVGLVTNHTARVDTSDGGPAHLIDRLHAAPGVTLGALFGPEHGLRGTEEAGAVVGGGQDPGTGVPVYSLYGASRKPSPSQMSGLDALVFDMQDVGARFYTYISTMGYAMQAAAEAGVPFVVLDRPNPIGGLIEGARMLPRHESFVGLYPIPVTHGLTVGELARMIQGERMLPGLDGLEVRVVEMEGYQRDMLWEATGLPWVPPSPNIPDVETARVYPGAGFFEGTEASEGRGTLAPFRQVGAAWADGERIAADLNERGLPGVRFEATTFTPRDLPGMATNPKGEGRALGGVRWVVTDPAAFRPVEAGVHVLDAFYRSASRAERRGFFKTDWLAKLSGSDALRAGIVAGRSASEIVSGWAADVEAFATLRSRYEIYP